MIKVLRNSNFFLLWFGQLISMVGDWMLYLALPFFIYDLTGSAWATGLMFFIGNLPRLLVSSIAGVFVDRWDRKKTMVYSDILRGVLLLMILFIKGKEWIWIIYLVAFFQSALGQFFYPAKSAVVPEIVAEDELVTANSLNSLSDAITRLLGAASGGILVASLGFDTVVIIDAASFFFSALLIAFIVVPAIPVVSHLQADDIQNKLSGVWKELIQGFQLMRRTPMANVVFVISSLAVFGDSMIIVLVTPFVKDVIKADAMTLGWVIAAMGIGGLAGGLILGVLGSRASPQIFIPGALIVLSILVFLIANIPVIALIFPLIVLVGVCAVFWVVRSQALLQEEISDEYRGRAFGALGTITALMTLFGMILAGVGGEWLSISFMVNLVGVTYLVAGLLALVMLRSAKTSRFASDAFEKAGDD